MRKYILPTIILGLALALVGCLPSQTIQKDSQIQKSKIEGISLTDRTVRDNRKKVGKEYLRNMRPGDFWVAVSYFDAEKKLKEFNKKNPIPCPKGYVCSQWEIPTIDDWKNWEKLNQINSNAFSNEVRRYPYWTSEKHCNQKSNFCLPWEYAFWVEDGKFRPQNLHKKAFTLPVRYNFPKENLESKTK